jgi:hypothetical protein
MGRIISRIIPVVSRINKRSTAYFLLFPKWSAASQPHHISGQPHLSRITPVVSRILAASHQ